MQNHSWHASCRMQRTSYQFEDFHSAMCIPLLKFSKIPLPILVGTSKPLSNFHSDQCVHNRFVTMHLQAAVQPCVIALLREFLSHLTAERVRSEVANVTGNVKYILKSVFWHQSVSPPAPPAPPPMSFKLDKCCQNVFSSLKVIYILSKQHATPKRQVKFKIFFYLTVDILSHMLGDTKVHAYHVPQQKRATEFYEGLPQTLKSTLNFVLEKKTVVSLKFSRIMNAISEQKISHVTDGYVTADLYQARPDKPKIFWHYEITMLLIVHEYTLFVCIWSRTLLEEMKLDTHVLEETFPSYNLNFYFYFYTYTWQRMPIAPR